MATNQPPPNYGYGYDPSGGAPMGAPGMPPRGNGMAVAGLVLGILSLVLFFLTWPASLLGILGIIFGALGIGKANKVGKGKGMAIAGLVCGCVGLLISVVWTLFIISVASHGHAHF